MTLDFVAPLVVFAFASAITPGPNNIMLMASGANFGIRRSLPHMFGVTGGFTLMVALVGLGLAQVFSAHPAARTVLMMISVAYLLYLAFRIATAAPPQNDERARTGKPLSFLQAALFQWVNPKAWAMALTAVTVYAPDETALAALFVAAIFGAVNFPCITIWTVMGRQLRRILTGPRSLRIFNITMAVLLIASVYPMLF